MTSYARSIHRTIPHMKFSPFIKYSFTNTPSITGSCSYKNILSHNYYHNVNFHCPNWLLIQESFDMEYILHTWTTYCASCKVVHSYVVNSHNSISFLINPTIILILLLPFISIGLNPRLVGSTDRPITFLPAVTECTGVCWLEWRVFESWFFGKYSTETFFSFILLSTVKFFPREYFNGLNMYFYMNAHKTYNYDL